MTINPATVLREPSDSLLLLANDRRSCCFGAAPLSPRLLSAGADDMWRSACGIIFWGAYQNVRKLNDASSSNPGPPAARWKLSSGFARRQHASALAEQLSPRYHRSLWTGLTRLFWKQLLISAVLLLVSDLGKYAAAYMFGELVAGLETGKASSVYVLDVESHTRQ